MGTTLIGIRIEIPSCTRTFGVRQNAHALGSNTEAAVASGEIPPSQLLRDGRIALVPQRSLTAMETLRTKARRALLRSGILVGRLYAVPEDAEAETLQKLGQIKDEFQVAVEDFINGLDQAVHAQIQTYPQWEHLILDSVPTAASLRQAAKFQVTAYAISEPSTPYGKQAFVEACGAIVAGLVDEVVEAATAMTKVLASKGNKITAAERLGMDDQLLSLWDKARGFTYLHPEVACIADHLARALQEPPSPRSLRPLTNPVHLVASAGTSDDPEAETDAYADMAYVQFTLDGA